VIGGLIGLFRWFADRQAERERRTEEQERWQKDREVEREKRAEERFQSVVTGLGSEKEEAKVGAAIMLRTFLQPGYEQFYWQAFDLTVAHLRLRPADPNTSASLDPSEYVPVDSLSQALVTAFKESFPLARNALKKYGDPALVDQKQSALDAQMLDASRIRLDHAFLARSDLKGVLMRGAFLIGTNLRRADLREALLDRADLRGAD
jgi:pentapeptide repeat protein